MLTHSYLSEADYGFAKASLSDTILFNALVSQRDYIRYLGDCKLSVCVKFCEVVYNAKHLSSSFLVASRFFFGIYTPYDAMKLKPCLGNFLGGCNLHRSQGLMHRHAWKMPWLEV